MNAISKQHMTGEAKDCRKSSEIGTFLRGSILRGPYRTSPPLHLNAAADPARWRTVVGGLDFDAAVQMHCSLAVPVIAKRLKRQRQERRSFFGKHGRNLPFRGSVNARVGPALFPAIQIRLRLLQALEAQPLSGVFFAWPTPDSTLPLRSGSPTRQGRATAP
jgi:hypothetical protein